LILYHVYADESRQDAHRFMLYGLLFVPRGEPEQSLCEDRTRLRQQQHWGTEEFKWEKVSHGRMNVQPDDSISGAHAQARNSTLNQFHRENVELSDAKARTAAAQAKSDAAQRVAFLNPARANPALLQHDTALLQQAQAHEQNVQHRSDLADAAYQALPEEADAYATGHQVERDWDGKLLQW